MIKDKKVKTFLDKSLVVLKVFFAFSVLAGIAFTAGTFYPNGIAISNVNTKLDKYYVNKIKEMDLQEPEFVYNNDIQFVASMHKCINYVNFTIPKDKRVPYEMIIGQAALESAWGKSRFAIKGNNLFGIRTWNENIPHMLLIDVEKWPGWGVRVFASKCDSVKEYIRILNEHPAYEKFRQLRLITNDPIKLIKTLDKYSTTPDYDKRVIKVIGEIRKLEKQ
jgi:Bax protein